MSVLTNRRDITAQREASHDRGDAGALAALIAELAVLNERLGRQIRNVDVLATELVLTDREPAEWRMRNFPVPGVDRFIVRRAGAGGKFTLAAATPTLILAANENRLGLTIVNSGTSNPVDLFFGADLLQLSGAPLTAGAAVLTLVQNGGTWDGRLAQRLWSGNIIANSTLGTTVTVAEF